MSTRPNILNGAQLANLSTTPTMRVLRMKKGDRFESNNGKREGVRRGLCSSCREPVWLLGGLDREAICWDCAVP